MDNIDVINSNSFKIENYASAGIEFLPKWNKLEAILDIYCAARWRPPAGAEIWSPWKQCPDHRLLCWQTVVSWLLNILLLPSNRHLSLAPTLATLESYFTGFLVLFVASMITRFEPDVQMEKTVWKLVCYLFYVGGGNAWMEVNVHWKKEIFESFLTSLPTSGKVAFLMSHSNSPNFIFYLPFTFKMSSKFEPWLRATVWIQISEDGNGFVSSMSRPGSSSGPTLYSLHRSDRSFYPDLLAN